MIGISFGSLFPIKASFYEHEQSMSTIKVDVLHTLTASLDSYFQFWQLKCILMAKPKLKNVKKADPNYFSILHENMSPDFCWGPPGLRKWHYLKKFPWKKVVTHLKIFLRVIQNFWHGQNACDKKKVRVLLEDQCAPPPTTKVNIF